MYNIKKVWSQVISTITPLLPLQKKRHESPDLVEAVHESLRDWKLAKKQFNHADPALVEYMVYRLNAAERYYMALLSLAREQGVKAWPDNLPEPVKNPILDNSLPDINNPEPLSPKKYYSGSGL